MPIFQLSPRDPKDPAWFVLPLEAYLGRAVVRAPDEPTAREICSIAFGGYVAELDLDAPAPVEAAWSSDALVSCEILKSGRYPADGPIEVLFPHPLKEAARIAVEQFARILATSPRTPA